MADSVAHYFSELQGKIDPANIAGMNATYQFLITGDAGGDWTVKLDDGAAEVSEGQGDDPSITITVSDENFLAITDGSLSGESAFLTGKLTVKGDMALAMKLKSILG
jgi:putative sterol carrier protein